MRGSGRSPAGSKQCIQVQGQSCTRGQGQRQGQGHRTRRCLQPHRWPRWLREPALLLLPLLLLLVVVVEGLPNPLPLHLKCQR